MNMKLCFCVIIGFAGCLEQGDEILMTSKDIHCVFFYSQFYISGGALNHKCKHGLNTSVSVLQ